MAKFCTGCGNQCGDDEIKCYRCGKMLGGEDDNVNNAGQMSDDDLDTNIAQYANQYARLVKSKQLRIERNAMQNKRRLSFVGTALIVLCVLIIVVRVMYPSVTGTWVGIGEMYGYTWIIDKDTILECYYDAGSGEYEGDVEDVFHIKKIDKNKIIIKGTMEDESIWYRIKGDKLYLYGDALSYEMDTPYSVMKRE